MNMTVDSSSTSASVGMPVHTPTCVDSCIFPNAKPAGESTYACQPPSLLLAQT